MENTEGKNASDVEILQKAIGELVLLGTDVPTDLNVSNYTWDESGKLTGIIWEDCGCQGALSLEGLTSLEYLSCDTNKLSSLNVSGCTSLEKLYCYHNKLSSLDVSNCKSSLNLLCDSTVQVTR